MMPAPEIGGREALFDDLFPQSASASPMTRRDCAGSSTLVKEFVAQVNVI
jgi:hypothetical protein